MQVLRVTERCGYARADSVGTPRKGNATGLYVAAVDSLVGLPPGEFATPIFDVVLNALTIPGSIVGARNDISEALAFAADGKVKTLDRMKQGQIQRRMTLS